MAYTLPQLYHIYKRKSASDISALSLFVRLLCYASFITHGVFIDDSSLLYMTIAVFGQTCVLVVQKVFYHYKNQGDNKISPQENIQS